MCAPSPWRWAMAGASDSTGVTRTANVMLPRSTTPSRGWASVRRTAPTNRTGLSSCGIDRRGRVHTAHAMTR